MKTSAYIIIGTILGLLALVSVIIYYVYKSEIANDRINEGETCTNCKYLVEYNDGHVECWLKIEKACIDNSLGLRYFKEKKANEDGREDNSNI